MQSISDKTETYDDHQSIGVAGCAFLGATALAIEHYKEDLFHWAVNLRYMTLLSGIAAPINAMSLINHAHDFATGKQKDRVDALAGMMANASSLCYNTSVILDTLREMQVVGEWAVKFADKLMIISMPLQVGWLVVNIRFDEELKAFARELGLRKPKWDQQDIEKVKAYFTDKQKASLLKRDFQIRSSKSLRDIAAGLDEKKLGLLKDRIWSLRLSAKLQIAANVTMLIAGFIFFTNPLSGSLYFIYLQWTVITVGGLVYDTRSQYNFAKAMNLPRENIIPARLARFAMQNFDKLNRHIDHVFDNLRGKKVVPLSKA